jgi:hypothetical protein
VDIAAAPVRKFGFTMFRAGRMIGAPLGAAVLLAALGAGCGNTLPLSAGDTCGQRGLEFAGLSETRGRIGGSVRLRGEVEATSVHCVPAPERERDRYCSVEAYRARAWFKGRNDWFWPSTRDKLMQRADAIWDGTYERCMADVASN